MDLAQVLALIDNIYDPDHPDKTLREMGVVEEQGIEIEPHTIRITYCLKSPVCPFSAAIGILIRRALMDRVDRKVEVRLSQDHYQAPMVNAVLSSESQSAELASRMEAAGLFDRCIRA